MDAHSDELESLVTISTYERVGMCSFKVYNALRRAFIITQNRPPIQPSVESAEAAGKLTCLSGSVVGAAALIAAYQTGQPMDWISQQVEGMLHLRFDI